MAVKNRCVNSTEEKRDTDGEVWWDVMTVEGEK